MTSAAEQFERRATCNGRRFHARPGCGLCAWLAFSLIAALLAVVPSAASAQTNSQQPTPSSPAPIDGDWFGVPTDWPLIPSGVGPGETFRLVFQTSGTTDARSMSLYDYDDFVQEAAGGGHGHIRPYARRFKALGSTGSTPVRERLEMWDAATSSWMDSGTPIPVYWLNGPRIAQSYSDLFDGSWENFGPQHRRQQSGNANNNTDTPWTGTATNGSSDASHYLGRFSEVRVGGSAAGEDPMSQDTEPSADSHTVYGMSPVFRVTPSSGMLFRVCPDGGCEPDSDTGWVETTTPHLTIHEGEQGVYQYKLFGHFPEPYRMLYSSFEAFSDSTAPGGDVKKQAIWKGSATFDEDRIKCYATASHSTDYWPDMTHLFNSAGQQVRLAIPRDGNPENLTGGCPILAGYIDWSERDEWHTVRLRAGQDKDSQNHSRTFWQSTLTYDGYAGSKYKTNHYGNKAPGSDGRYSVSLTIIDDEGTQSDMREAPAGVSITPVNRTVTEGQPAVFTLSADSSVTKPATVNVVVESYETRAHNVAVASQHLGRRQVTIPAGGTARLEIPTTDNTLRIANSYITARLVAGNGYQANRIADIATVGVLSDEAPPPPPPQRVAAVRIGPTSIDVGVDPALGIPDTGPWSLWWNARGNGGGSGSAVQNHLTISGLEPHTGYVGHVSRSGGDYVGWFRVFTGGEHDDSLIVTPPWRTISAMKPVVQVSKVADVTEGAAASFTLTANPAPAANLPVRVKIVGIGEYGVTDRLRTITIPTTGTKAFTVATTGDNVDEPDGIVTATIVDRPEYEIGADSSDTVNISDDDPSAAGSLPSDHPLWKHYVLIELAYKYIGEPGTNAHGPNGYRALWKQVLKAFGHPEYVYYPRRALTEAEARAQYVRSGDERWEPIGDAIADTVAYGPLVNISRASSAREGSDVTFEFTAVPPPTSDLDITMEVTTQGDFGVTAGPRTVTIPNTGTFTLTLDTDDDNVDEPNGWVEVALNQGAGYRLGLRYGFFGALSRRANIYDNDRPEPSGDVPLVSIAAGADVVEGAAASFTLTASPELHADLPVTVRISSTGDYGVTERLRRFTISTTGTRFFTIATSDDEVDEPDGTVTATVLDGIDYDRGRVAAATVNITDDDDPVPVVNDDSDPLVKYAALIERIKTDMASPNYRGEAHDLKRVLKTLGVPGYADYSGGAVGVQEATNRRTQPSDNPHWEGIAAAIEYVNNYDPTNPPPPDPDPEVSISAGSSVTEGTAASFSLSASPAPTSAVTVQVDIAAAGSFGVTTGVRDVVVPTTGSVSFTVPTTDDDVDEADGSATATVQSGTGYTVGTPSAGTVVIADDDDPPVVVPEVSITAGAGVIEGAAASFTLSASPAPTAALSVQVDVTAAGSFGVTTGVRTVQVPTSGSVTFTVPTTGDEVDEADGSVTATVQAGSGYTVDSTADDATVVVADDDAAPAAVPPLEKFAALVKSFYDRITATSGHGNGAAGGWNKRFLKAMGHPEYVNYPQDAVTVARAQELYDHGGPGANTAWEGTVEALEYKIAFDAGQVTVDPVIPPPPDPDPEVAISAGADVTEGADASFTLNASPAPTAALTVKVDITAAGSYGVATGVRNITVPTSGTVTFTVPTTGDDVDEADGSATATVQAGTGYTVGTPSAGTVAIADNDDPPVIVPEITISAGAGVTEGADASFTLNASPAPTTALTVKLDITAAGSYGVATGARSITVPTSGTVTFSVPTTGDDVDEPDGSATATVETGTGYTVGSPSAGTVSIADNDDPPKKEDPKAGFVASIEQLRDDYSAYENWATGTYHQYMVHYSAGEILNLLNADTPAANSVSNQALFFRAIRAAKGARDSNAATLFAQIRDHYRVKKIG